ncbi:MAG: peptide-methionine (R)-S-oxide reductase, partial [Planctomycetes bacterium]|nr:peptide-methionine (R)-S-oxide reductase [Planctomycetota bacterium]
MHEKEPSTPSASKPREAPQPPSGGKVVLSDEEWRRRLTPEQYRVCREKGTERAFTGKHWNAKAKGTYACVACGNALFSSETK